MRGQWARSRAGSGPPSGGRIGYQATGYDAPASALLRRVWI